MTTYRICKAHGTYEGKTCPKCPKVPSKASKKYGGTTITIPPHMRAK